MCDKKSINSVIKKMPIFIIIIAFFTILLSVNSFAESSVTFNGENSINIEDILKSKPVQVVKDIVVKIVNPLSTISIGACIFGLMLSKNTKQAESYLVGIKGVVWAFFLLNCLGLMFLAIGTIIEPHAYRFS